MRKDLGSRCHEFGDIILPSDLGHDLDQDRAQDVFAGIQERHQCRTSASGLSVFREWPSFSLCATPTKPQRCIRTRHQLSPRLKGCTLDLQLWMNMTRKPSYRRHG